jgi:hypothetical protein
MTQFLAPDVTNTLPSQPCEVPVTPPRVLKRKNPSTEPPASKKKQVSPAKIAAKVSPKTSPITTKKIVSVLRATMLATAAHASTISVDQEFEAEDYASTTCSDGFTPSDEKIDISTEHIKALTGDNWVTACGTIPIPPGIIAQSDSNKSRSRRNDLTADERACQNRDRNRDHARNTRLRKKAYVDELKRALIEVVAQRDALELETKNKVQREFEQREVRFRVVEEFLKLRGRNETDYVRWATIMEDDFALTLPVTAFRGMVSHGGEKQVVEGVSSIMADAGHLSRFLTSFGNGNLVLLQYKCDRKDFLMDGCNAALEWEATAVGATTPLSFKGHLKVRFSPASNKLHSATMSFDTGAMMARISTSLYTPSANMLINVVHGSTSTSSLTTTDASV